MGNSGCCGGRQQNQPTCCQPLPQASPVQLPAPQPQPQQRYVLVQLPQQQQQQQSCGGY